MKRATILGAIAGDTIGSIYEFSMGSYGGNFGAWLDLSHPRPYASWGNGSAMRCSAAGFASNTLEETLEAAKVSAEVTHNHPEAVSPMGLINDIEKQVFTCN